MEMERAARIVDLVVREVTSVALVLDRNLRGHQGVICAHSLIGVRGIAGVPVRDTDTFRVVGVAVFEDHGPRESQWVIRVEP